MALLDLQLGDDDSWECQHVTSAGVAAPSAQLIVGRTERNPISVDRRYVTCEECRTCWCVWPQHGIARPYIKRLGDCGAARLHRPPQRDIERVIARVSEVLPNLEVRQLFATRPEDDDGLWWLGLPDVRPGLQLESSTGECPFLFEHDGAKSGGDTVRTLTVEETVSLCVQTLQRFRSESQVCVPTSE